MKKDINHLLFNKDSKIIIIFPFGTSEVTDPKFGGTRLIYEQIRFFKENGYKVYLVSLTHVGSVTSFLYKLEQKLRRTVRSSNISEKKRWWLNLFKILITELSSRIDILFKIKLKYLLKNISFPVILLYNYPFGVKPFVSVLNNFERKIIIYEHNVEWKFFQDKIGKNFFGKFFVWLIKKIELNNLKKADYIICATHKDKEVLIKEGNISFKKMKVWLPLSKKNIKVNADKIPNKLKKELRGKYVIGFVGTNFEPNIIAVKNILKIAKKVSKDVVFLIIGSVNKAFIYKKQIPPNVIFTGYVNDLDSYLALCNAFINPKTTSDTGIEIKMFDYLKFNKPIISTEIGARGFENFKNTIIVKDIDEIIEIIGKIK